MVSKVIDLQRVKNPRTEPLTRNSTVIKMRSRNPVQTPNSLFIIFETAQSGLQQAADWLLNGLEVVGG